MQRQTSSETNSLLNYDTKPVKSKKWYKDINAWKLLIMCGMVFIVFVAELLTAIVGGSLTLLADSFHMISDGLSLLIGFFALVLSKQKPNKSFSFGFSRAETYGGLVNGIFLLTVVFFIFIEAIKKALTPEKIERPILVLVVGTIGIVVNIIGMLMFCGHVPHAGHNHAEHEKHEKKHKKAKKDEKLKEKSKVEKIEERIVKKDDEESRIQTSEQTNLEKLENSIVISTVASEPKNAENCEEIKVINKEENETVEIKQKIEEKEQKAENPEEKHEKGEKKKEKKHKHGHKHQAEGSHNLFGVFLHTMGDFLGSVGVIISAVIILIFGSEGWTLYVDPALSFIIAGLILFSGIPLVYSTSKIVLQSVPASIKLKGLKQELKAIYGVDEVHELHVWTLNGAKNIGSVHVSLSSFVNDTMYMQAIVSEIQNIFHKFHVHSLTIQPEFISNALKEELERYTKLEAHFCNLNVCSEECLSNRCCAPAEKKLRKRAELPKQHSA